MNSDRLLPDDQAGVALSDVGDIGLDLPDGRPTILLGPRSARGLAEALMRAADGAELIRARNQAEAN